MIEFNETNFRVYLQLCAIVRHMDGAPSPWLAAKLAGLVTGTSGNGSADQEKSPAAGIRENLMERRDNVHKAATQLGRRLSTRINAAPAAVDEDRSVNDASQGNLPGIVGGLMKRREDLHKAATQLGRRLSTQIIAAPVAVDEDRSVNDASQGNSPGMIGGLMKRREDLHKAAIELGQHISTRVTGALEHADESQLVRRVSSARAHLNGEAGVMRKASTQKLNKGQKGSSADSETESDVEELAMEASSSAAPKRKLSIRKGPKAIEQD